MPCHGAAYLLVNLTLPFTDFIVQRKAAQLLEWNSAGGVIIASALPWAHFADDRAGDKERIQAYGPEPAKHTTHAS